MLTATETDLIQIKNLSAKYGDREILKDISISVKAQECWAVLGPNGAGKSTFVKLIAGMLHQSSGSILVDGKSIHNYHAKRRAQLIAYVPQKPENKIPYSVYDFIMLGRYCLMGVLGIASEKDHAAVDEALTVCDVRHLAYRQMYTLSGGELQRVLLAGAVAQSSPILLLDEPTTFLDPAHDRLFFTALERLHAKRDLTVLMITHDINNAICQCTNIAVIKEGMLAFCGTTSEFKSQCPSILSSTFDIPFNQFVRNDTGTVIYGSWGVK